jgi:hypothetical protein
MTSTLVKVGAIATTAAALYAPLGVPAANTVVIDMLSRRQSQSPNAVFPVAVSSSNVRGLVATPSLGNGPTTTLNGGATMQQIARIRALTDGWMGENSHAPSPEIVDRFAAVGAEVDQLPRPSSLAPTGDGGLLLEWMSSGDEYTAEIEPDGSLFMSVAFHGGEFRETAVDFDPVLLKRFISSGSWVD